MELIKGSYELRRSMPRRVDRWLDPATGRVYMDAGGQALAIKMVLINGYWRTVDGAYTFTPDVAFETSDWFVLSCMPGVKQHSVQGPFTESQARESATQRAGKYPRNTYAVFRVLPGNRVTVVPPTPPEPEVVWS